MSEILSSPDFLLGTVVLVLLALLFVLFPILRAGTSDSKPARRLRALEELREDLDPADYRERRAKLQLEQAKAGGSAGSSSSLRGLAGLLVVSVPLLTIFFYTQVGTPQGIDPAPGQNGELREILGELTSRVRAEPEDVDAWNRLGVIWKQLQQYPASEGAFRRVVYIEPENEFARVELAETLLYASNRANLPEESRDLLVSVLTDNPDNQKALWLAGLGAFHDGDQQRALALWTRLRDLLPEGNVRQQVSDQIAEITGAPAPEPVEEATRAAMVNPHSAMPPARSTSPGSQTPQTSQTVNQPGDERPAGASIQVEVTLDPALAGRITGTETVFVFARAVNGPPAPLAVKRLSASDLPTTVMLSDSDSMAQGLSLSTFPQVQISARISRTGNAIASAGDLQGQSGPVTVEETDRLGIVIDEVIE